METETLGRECGTRPGRTFSDFQLIGHGQQVSTGRHLAHLRTQSIVSVLFLPFLNSLFWVWGLKPQRSQRTGLLPHSDSLYLVEGSKLCQGPSHVMGSQMEMTSEDLTTVPSSLSWLLSLMSLTCGFLSLSSGDGSVSLYTTALVTSMSGCCSLASLMAKARAWWRRTAK